MSLVVGIEHEGTIYMGADSGGWRSGFEDAGAGSKIIRAGPLLIGCTGDMRAQNVLEHCVDDLPADLGESVERYLVREFIPRLREAVDRHGAAQKFEEDTHGWGGHLMIGARGELYLLSSIYCVFRNARGYAAAGAEAGAGVALGVLYATQGDTFGPQSRITMALQAAEEHTNACRSPFHMRSLPENGSQHTVGAVRQASVGEHAGVGVAGPSLA